MNRYVLTTLRQMDAKLNGNRYLRAAVAMWFKSRAFAPRGAKPRLRWALRREERMREILYTTMVSDDTIPYKLHDLLPRKGKYMCEQCSNICQQPKFHAEVSECPRQVLPVDMNRNRAMGIEPDPCRISGPQLETKKRKKQCETKKSSSMQDESLQENFPFKHPFCKKLKYKTAVNANKHMEAKHAELKLELYPVGTRTKRRKNRTSPPKATVVKTKSVPVRRVLLRRSPLWSGSWSRPYETARQTRLKKRGLPPRSSPAVASWICCTYFPATK